MTECHKCKHYNSPCDACLSCDGTETYSYRYSHYILDTYEPRQEDTSGTEKCTHLSEDDEDRLRIAISNLFDLQPLELLCLQAIMQRKSLETFAKDMTTLMRKSVRQMEKNKDGRFTRFHAFQLRKSILKKLPDFRDALLTNGQRKKLKP